MLKEESMLMTLKINSLKVHSTFGGYSDGQIDPKYLKAVEQP
jgi:hypothetical protein